MTLLVLLATAFAKPFDLTTWDTVSVAYTMTTTGSRSCATTFRGTGTKPVVDKDRITFVGTWEIVSDTCQGATIWAPADKVAHHTLRLDKTGKGFEEWVVHAKAEDHVRFESDIAARGQYWINELAAAPGSPGAQGDVVVAWKGTEEQGIFPLTVTIAHDLAITLSPPAPPPTP